MASASTAYVRREIASLYRFLFRLTFLFDVWLHAESRHSPDIMSEFADLSAPVVCRTTGLHADNTYRYPIKALQKVFAFDRLIACDIAGIRNPVNLENILGQVQADYGNLRGVAPLLQMMTPALRRIATPVEQEPSNPSALGHPD